MLGWLVITDSLAGVLAAAYVAGSHLVLIPVSVCCGVVLQGSAELVAFDPFAPQPKMSYKDGYQKRYFVLDSFEVRPSWHTGGSMAV